MGRLEVRSWNLPPPLLCLSRSRIQASQTEDGKWGREEGVTGPRLRLGSEKHGPGHNPLGRLNHEAPAVWEAGLEQTFGYVKKSKHADRTAGSAGLSDFG